MSEERLRAGLQEAGLSQYEADAYLEVLERGTAPVVKIADKAGVPKSRIYDVLRDLEAEGYVETFDGDSLSVRALDPSDVLDDLQGRAHRLMTTAEEIEDRWERPDMGDHRIQIVKRFDSVLDQFEAVADEATNQIQIAVTPSQFERVRPVLRDAVDRGVFVKLCLATGFEDAHAVDEIEFADAATEARHRTLPAPFTALVDRTHAFFSSTSTPTDQYGIIIDDLTLTYVFHWYFQSALWETWQSLSSHTWEDGKQEYVDIRECIQDIAPAVDAGAEIVATVHGFDTQTGGDVTLPGRIVDIISAGSPADDESLTLTHLAGQATVVLESEGTEYGIGGRGTTLEDVEATRIVLDPPEYLSNEGA